MSDKLLIAKTPTEINFWHLCSLRGALRLEKIGMTRSRGGSALSIAKKKYGLKRNVSFDDAIAVVQADIDRHMAARRG
jgi:hypothetical protein